MFFLTKSYYHETNTTISQNVILNDTEEKNNISKPCL